MVRKQRLMKWVNMNVYSETTSTFHGLMGLVPGGMEWGFCG